MELLKKKGLIERTMRRGNGKHQERVAVRGEFGYVAGVDIGGTNLRVVVADMSGAIVGKWCGSTVEASAPGKIVQLVQTGVKQVLRQAGLRQGSLLGIAAGAPGVTDSKKGVVLLTSYLGGWKNVPLGKLLEESLGVPAAVENDVRLGAMGERWRGSAQGRSDFVFLAIGTGIAAGIYANGELLRGPDFAAGEVGYLMVPGTAEAAAREGMPGALESAIGGEGIRQQWQQSTERMYGEALNDLSATDIFERALTGDGRAEAVLNRAAQMLAYAVYNMSVVLNCSLFILGGGVGMSPILRDAAQRVLERFTEPARPKMCLSSLGQDAQLIGALRLALDLAERRAGIRS